jgi:thiol-disulfide isomerase/thioredoxin
VQEAWNVSFSGKGAEKYKAYQEIQLIGESANRTNIAAGLSQDEKKVPDIILRKQEEQALAVLDKYKVKLSPEVYEVLRAQVKGRYGHDVGRRLEVGYFFDRNKSTEDSYRVALDRYLIKGKSDLDGATELDVRSPKYIDYLAKYVWLRYYEEREKRAVSEGLYFFCKSITEHSKASDRVLATLLISRFAFDPDAIALDDALQTIKDPYALSRVSLLGGLLPGREAFDFNLPDTEGSYHKLSDFEGKVVFIDFWYASCLPCRQYMKDVLAPVKKHYADNPNVVFVTVSIDDQTTFKRVVGQLNFLSEGSVNLYTENNRARHPIIDHYQIRGYPHPLLISKDRKVLTGGKDLKTVESLTRAIDKALKR